MELFLRTAATSLANFLVDYLCPLATTSCSLIPPAGKLAAYIAETSVLKVAQLHNEAASRDS